MKFLKKHAEGAVEGEPSYMYGVVEGFGGTLWDTLYFHEFAAREAAKTLEGSVVIVACRVLEDEEGEHWPLPVRTKAIEEKESAEDLEASRASFEQAIRSHVAEKVGE